MTGKPEQKAGSGECEHLMVYLSDWKPGDPPPPDEEITVEVSYPGSRKPPEKMTLAEYRRRFPDMGEDVYIPVRYE